MTAERTGGALIGVFDAYPLRGFAVVLGSVSMLGVASVVGGVISGEAGWIAFGVILLLVFSGPTCGVVRMCVIRVRLFERCVTTPGIVSGSRSIELSDIAGVGLRFLSDGRATGWRTFLWLQDGARVRLIVPGPTRSAPPGRRRRFRSATNWVPPLDWEYVNASAAGKATRKIYDTTLALQGPNGLLAAKQDQVTASSGGGFETAYWSPDGRIGPLEPLRQ